MVNIIHLGHSNNLGRELSLHYVWDDHLCCDGTYIPELLIKPTHKTVIESYKVLSNTTKEEVLREAVDSFKSRYQIN